MLVNPGLFVRSKARRRKRALARLPVATGLVATVNERLQVQRYRYARCPLRHGECWQSFTKRTIVNMPLIGTMGFPDDDERHRLRTRLPEFRTQSIGQSSETTTYQIDFVYGIKP